MNQDDLTYLLVHKVGEVICVAKELYGESEREGVPAWMVPVMSAVLKNADPQDSHAALLYYLTVGRTQESVVDRCNG